MFVLLMLLSKNNRTGTLFNKMIICNKVLILFIDKGLYKYAFKVHLCNPLFKAKAGVDCVCTRR